VLKETKNRTQKAVQSHKNGVKGHFTSCPKHFSIAIQNELKLKKSFNDTQQELKSSMLFNLYSLPFKGLMQKIVVSIK